MSTKAEKIAAQAKAFYSKPTKPWHRHLIGPAELSWLLSPKPPKETKKKAP